MLQMNELLCSVTDACESSHLKTVSRYLFPFVLEYSLIAIGVIAFTLYNGIGPKGDVNGHHNVARGFKNLIKVFADTIYVNKKNHVDNNNNNQSRDSQHDSGILKTICYMFDGGRLHVPYDIRRRADYTVNMA